MMIIALAIKCESTGPVLHGEACVGVNGQHFVVLSFRTTAQGNAFHGRHGTRMGEFLHYTRIADLPQLINVLRGELTLIGGSGKPHLLY